MKSSHFFKLSPKLPLILYFTKHFSVLSRKSMLLVWLTYNGELTLLVIFMHGVDIYLKKSTIIEIVHSCDFIAQSRNSMTCLCNFSNFKI